jgi:DNA-binding NarL/FixJ family response regulator
VVVGVVDDAVVIARLSLGDIQAAVGADPQVTARESPARKYGLVRRHSSALAPSSAMASACAGPGGVEKPASSCILHLRRLNNWVPSTGVERARRELRATGETAHRRAESGSENLTLQEPQVALKVAAGATNREVAAALFLSPKTIEVHLGRIYSKLGLRSRTELARCFAQEGGDSFGSGRPELSHHSTSSD